MWTNVLSTIHAKTELRAPIHAEVIDVHAVAALLESTVIRVTETVIYNYFNFLIPGVSLPPIQGEGLPYNNDGGDCRIFSRELLKGTRNAFCECGLHNVLPLRDTNFFWKVAPVSICFWLNTLNGIIITLTVVKVRLSPPSVIGKEIPISSEKLLLSAYVSGIIP